MALAGAAPAAADDGRKPSFDCRQAQSQVQREICASERLAALDRAMDELYRAFVVRAPPPQRAGAEAERKAWLMARDGLCRAGDPEIDCWVGLSKLDDLYRQRVAALAKDLRSLGGAQAQRAFITGRYLSRKWPMSGEIFLAELPDGSVLLLLLTIRYSYALTHKCALVERLSDRRGDVLHYRNANISKTCAIEITVTGGTAVLRETLADCNDLEKHHCEFPGYMRGSYEKDDSSPSPIMPHQR